MANPHFNDKEWWSESLADDPRWAYGIPPEGNANYAWIQHMIYHLSPNGRMGFVLANGSMSSQTNSEIEIRKAIIEADLVEAMVALPAKLFTNVRLPACIWFLNRNKKRKGEVLFIDARQIGYMKDRVLRDFTADDIAKIANTLHAWQKSDGYEDQAAFCKSASLEEIAGNDFVLTPGRYVGTAEQEDDGVPFAEKMQNLTALLKEQFAKSAELEAEIKKNLGDWGMNKVEFGALFLEPLRNGVTKPKRVRGSGYKMVNMGEIFSLSFIQNQTMDRVPLTDKEKATTLLQNNDLLFARQSLVRDGAGKCSIFLNDNEPVCFESHIIRVRLNQELCYPMFYYYFLVVD